MRIRPAEINDAAELATVNARSWQSAYPGIIPDDTLVKVVALQSEETYWKQIIQLRPRLHLTAVLENEAGKILGCATFGPERNGDRQYKGELYSLYLLPEYQKQGLGRMLVSEVGRQLEAQGMTSMLVWVLTQNHAARCFYERLDGKWLREGEFDIGGLWLPTVAYGWQEISVLRPRSTLPAIKDQAASASVSGWASSWLQRWRTRKKM